MELSISKNGRFIKFRESIVDLTTKQKIDINSPNPFMVCEIMKSNFIFSHKNMIFENNFLLSEMRKIIYSFLSFEPNSLLEYELRFGKNLILESEQNNITVELIEESWNFVIGKLALISGLITENDLWDWVKDVGSNVVKGAKKVGSELYQNVKKDASSAWNYVKEKGAEILKGGLKNFFDTLREFLMSPVGIGLDVALTAIGVGKVASIVIWGALLIWELYQLSQDVNFSTIMNVVFASLGVIFPAFAKTGKAATSGMKSVEQVAATSFGSKALSYLNTGLSKLLGALKQGAEWLGGIFGPSVQNFIRGAVSGAEVFIKKVIKFLTPKSYKTGEKLTKDMIGYGLQKGVQGAAVAKGIEVGLHSKPGQQIVRGAVKTFQDLKGSKPEEEMAANLKNVEFDFKGGL